VRQALEQRTGLEMFESSNTFERMTQPLKELMALVRATDLQHGGNPVARWHADSLEVKSPRDDPDRMRPVKPERHAGAKRIDAMAALLHALEARLMVQTPALTPGIAMIEL
jgi:phage terminase large subunit-like protein